jgi:hypothetical protein
MATFFRHFSEHLNGWPDRQNKSCSRHHFLWSAQARTSVSRFCPFLALTRTTDRVSHPIGPMVATYQNSALCAGWVTGATPTLILSVVMMLDGWIVLGNADFVIIFPGTGGSML